METQVHMNLCKNVMDTLSTQQTVETTMLNRSQMFEYNVGWYNRCDLEKKCTGEAARGCNPSLPWLAASEDQGRSGRS